MARKPADPAAEGTSDQSTRSASGQRGSKPERFRKAEALEDDPIARTRTARHATPRRYEQEVEDAAMPADDSSLNTKI
jgi:hypothetical protein